MADAPNFITPEEYLRFERASEQEREYVDGRMYAMAGVNKRHGAGSWGMSILNSSCRSKPSTMASHEAESLPFAKFVADNFESMAELTWNLKGGRVLAEDLCLH